MAVMPAVEAPPVELSSVILEGMRPARYTAGEMALAAEGQGNMWEGARRYTAGEMALAAEGNMPPSQSIA
eukprot:5495110-Prymnesium_polylepis.1